MKTICAQPASGRIILNFHGIGMPHAGLDASEAPYWCRHDIFVAIIDIVAGAIAREGASIDITFDDGNRSDLDIAAPVLRKAGLTGMFFACSGRLDDPCYLAPADLVALQEMGMTIGSHGCRHVDLRQVSTTDLEIETKQSRRDLEAACGCPVDLFAIPFGSYDRRVLGALDSYRQIYSSDQATARPGQVPIPRFSYVDKWTTEYVRGLIHRREGIGQRLRHRVKTALKGLR